MNDTNLIKLGLISNGVVNAFGTAT